MRIAPDALAIAHAAFAAADDAWAQELAAAFGPNACNMRYLPAGRALPGHAAREVARLAWERARGEANALQLARQLGAPVYLNISETSIRRNDVSREAPAGMVTDWARVLPDGTISRCL